MTYNSVAEILDSIDETRAQIFRRLDGLNAAQENFRPAPEAWSIAEIVEHLSIIEGQMVQLIGMMLKKTEAAAAEAATAAGATHAAATGQATALSFAPVSIDEFAEQSKKQKYTAPQTVRPSGTLAVADSLARLRQTRAAIHSLRPRIEQVDGTVAHFRHPNAGLLNLYQWLLFIGYHEGRHLAQIETVMKAQQETTSEVSSSQ